MRALIFKHKTFYLLVLAFWSALFLVVFCFPKGEPSLYINRFHNTLCDYLFYAITFLGDGLFAVLLLVGTFLFVNRRKALVMTGAFLSVVFVAQVLKNFVFPTAPRPHTFFQHLSDVYYIPWIEIHGFNSFPSGHTAQAFCLALCVLFYVKEQRYLISLFTLAVLTGFSRIYLMQHFPEDVLAGSIIGVLVTTITFYFFEHRIGFLQRSGLDSPLIHLQKQ